MLALPRNLRRGHLARTSSLFLQNKPPTALLLVLSAKSNLTMMMKSDDHEDYMNNRDDDDDDGGDGDMMDGSGMREVEVREQDRFLPIANIARIMKTELPGNAKIAKDAKESIQECVSEFISFITSEASDKCLQEKRKTINGDDLLWAMSTLGFDKYIDPLKLYLSKYRDSVKGEKPEKKPSAASMRKNEQGGGSGGNISSSNTSNVNQHHTNTSVGTLGSGGMNMNVHSNMNMNLGLNMSNPNQMQHLNHTSNVGMTNPQNNVVDNNGLMNTMNMLPSVSNLSGYTNYDASSGNSLLMGGNIEASPLFLGAGGGKLGDSLLPPLPKKRDGPAQGPDLQSFPVGVNAAQNAQKKHKTG